jgi:hypothetical protein
VVLARRRKIPIIILRRTNGPGGVDLTVVEFLALLGIADEIVGAGDLLELLLRLRIAGVEIWMKFLRKFTIRFLQSVGRRSTVDSEDLVWIVHQHLQIAN